MNQIKKLRPLVQLVPAVAVAAIVLVTLPRTLPVLAEVPERLSPAVSSSAAVEEPELEEEDILPTLPYEDGVYTGSSRGYGGTVRVQVTMEGGRITDLQILNASHETSAFLRRARRLLTTVLTAQTWEVDAVSEATYTSRGILGAIQNALTGEVVNNPLPPKQETPEPIVEEPFEAPSAYRDGVYTASAQGFGGPITVQVTVQNDTITDISILSHDGETTSYFARARKVVSEILTTGTPDVDSVSGATYSSTGILNAVKRALAKAAVDAEPVEEPAETPVTEPQGDAAEPEGPTYVDGVYTGTGESTRGPVTVSVTVTDGRVAGVTIVPTQTEPEEKSFWEKAKDAWKTLVSGKQDDADTDGGYYLAEELEGAIQDALKQAQSGAAVSEPAEEEPASQPAASEAQPETPAVQEPAASSAAETPAQEPAAEVPAASARAEEPAASSAPAEEAAPAAPRYRDGTYTATVVCTDDAVFHYDVRVTITVSGGAVTDVQAVKENDTSEEPADNRRYLDFARNGKNYGGVQHPGLVSQILEKQSADEVDLISGATYSSKALQAAAQQALGQAK